MASLTTASTATSLTFSQPNQVSDNNSQGTVIGTGPNDKVSFFGAPATTQPLISPNNAVALNWTDNGTLTKYQITNSTSAPGATTTLETTSTVTGIQSTDIVFVNKPAAQAGLGVAGYRASAANTIGITYTNISSGAITTTAESYDVVGISSNYTITQALAPTAVPATTGNEQLFTVNGATPGTIAIVNKPSAQAGLGITNARVSADDQVALTFLNNSSAAITPTANETYTFAFLPTLQVSDRTLVYRFNQASTAVAQTSSAEVTTAITGLLATDIVAGASKPSAQTGLGVGGYRVSSAGNIAIQLTNAGAAVTSTAESYSATILRQIAKSPLVVTTVPLTPVSVAATTTAEQTFTVPLLNVSTSVIVNKPSFTPGLHVVGYRVSAASTLAITYQNSNTSAVVPPAETYTIAAIPLQGPGAFGTAGSTTNSIAVGFNGSDTASASLMKALLTLNLVSAA